MSSIRASDEPPQAVDRYETESWRGSRFDVSPTLAINQRIELERARGRNILHLGFGEARLPVAGVIAKALRESARENAYGPVTGALATRELAAGWMTRRGVPTATDQVALTPGSKAGLYALLSTLEGDLVLPRPSWVSYAAQARFVGKSVLWCDVPAGGGGIPDPDLLRPALDRARREGLRPGVIVLTIPDNPTGSVATEDVLRRVLAICEEHSIAVIADEIYRDLAYEPDRVPSAAQLASENTYVTTGLSKALSLGGWRVGVLRVPANSGGAMTLSRIEAFASEVWSCLPAPIEHAARVAFEEPPSVASYIRSARSVHGLLAGAIHKILLDLGCQCPAPNAAFYLYPAFSGLVDVRDDRELQRLLLERCGIATLPGSAFGDVATRLRLRLATTFLCGETLEEQQETLAAAVDERVLQLPRVLSQLHDFSERLEAAVG